MKNVSQILFLYLPITRDKNEPPLLTIKRIITFISIGILLLCSSTFAKSETNISFVENLGNPFTDIYDKSEEIYARNIWDLQLYDGLIFIGTGNSSNRGPSQNAGPVPIIVYDPQQNKFIKEGIVDEEQIDLFSVINNKLYIPGHDPTENWQLGNLYKRSNNGDWRKYRNIPEALHSYAMISHNSKMFLGLGLKKGAAISISEDNGDTWKNIPAGEVRVYSFLQVANKLYVTKKIKRKSYYKKKKYTGVLEFKEPDKLIPRPDLTDKILFPDIKFITKRSTKIVRPIMIGNKSIYIGADIHNDHQYEPFGVFIASSLDKNYIDIEQIPLPEHSQPWDILVNETKAFILLSKTIDDSSTEVIVMYSPIKNLNHWEKLLSFKSSTFARSFEILNGDFYFGMGSEIKSSKKWQLSELKPNTGSILRIKKKYIKQ